MGKTLIIKNADFSTNAISCQISCQINITKFITTFVDSKNGVTSYDDSNRKAVYPRFSIEQYRQSGFRFISVNVKSLGCHPFVTSIGPTGNAESNRKTFDGSNGYIAKKGVYTLNLDDINPNQSLIYFGLNIDKSQADISSDSLSDYIEITMFKENMI